MRISYNWLQEYVDVDLPPDRLAELLTLSGSEVESVGKQGPQLHPLIVTALITDMKQHAQGKLRVAQVDIGERSVQIVSGAPNVAVGHKVALALAGAVLPGGQPIEVTDFDGTASQGMLCSPWELELGDDATGVLLLPEDTPAGLPLREALALDDTIIELELYPNRPDCQSVVGMAREVAAITGTALREPQISVGEQGEPAANLVTITVDDPTLCPLYTGRVIRNVAVKPSPLWLQQRVTAGGMRPINNVVDVTNFVLLEMGQPLHAFDYGKLAGGQIRVRRAKDGEMLTTLDHEDRPLDSDVLVIADAVEPSCIAGVMGGAVSEVTTDTTSIFLEAAIFDSVSIRRTSRRLGLRSEASARFEKGLNPDGVIRALDRAAQLLAEIAGGEVCPGVLVCDATSREAKTVRLRPERVNRLLGVEIPVADMIEILQRLEFGVTATGPELAVAVPAHRLDIDLEADLIEEVARLYGYDRIPVTLPRGVARGGQGERLAVIDGLRDLLVGLGLVEALTYSFDAEANFNRLRLPPDHTLRRSVPIRNPLSEELGILRTTLLAQMLEVARHNASHQEPHVQAFQIGAVYIPSVLPVREQPDERQTLSVLLMGQYPRQWGLPMRQVDFYDLKGLLEVVFGHLGLDYAWERANHPSFHPGRCAQVQTGNTIFGFSGEIHPEVGRGWELPTRAYVAEIDLEAILPLVDRSVHMEKLPRFPGVSRDLALLAPDTVPAERIVQVIRDCGGDLIKDITLFDVYTGRQIPAGYRSLAYSLRYQAEDRTLTEIDIQQTEAVVISRLERELAITRR